MSKDKKILKAFEIVCRAMEQVPLGDRNRVLSGVWEFVKPRKELPNKKEKRGSRS